MFHVQTVEQTLLTHAADMVMGFLGNYYRNDGNDSRQAFIAWNVIRMAVFDLRIIKLNTSITTLDTHQYFIRPDNVILNKY